MRFWGKRGRFLWGTGVAECLWCPGRSVLLLSCLTYSRSSQMHGSISLHFLHQALLFSLSPSAYGQMIWNATDWPEATEVGLQQYKWINERMQSVKQEAKSNGRKKGGGFQMSSISGRFFFPLTRNIFENLRHKICVCRRWKGMAEAMEAMNQKFPVPRNYTEILYRVETVA